MTTIHALRFSVIGLAAAVATASFAQDRAEEPYFYGGVSIGQSRAKIDEERITASLLAAGLTTTIMARDERDTAYKLFGGYPEESIAEWHERLGLSR